MAKNLVIVESPTKAKTIKKYLGRNYQVIASNGHLRDLPKSSLGIDIDNNFEPKYINVRGKAKKINELKDEAKKAENIYLATDPDREGEAIAWHLSYLLDLDINDKNRVEFNEITKDTVTKAINNPRKIDMDLVNSQQARRLLDRIVGYKISPVLWKKIKSGLSAGRVQSVALKLVVEREKEIENFIPEEYWKIESTHNKDGKNFTANFFGVEKDNKISKLKLNNEEEVNKILDSIDKDGFKVIEVKKTKRRTKPYKPFTTSTLQQESSNKLGFSTSKTMMLAQRLYESGLISYMRTDSTRLSKEIVNETLKYIDENYGKEYRNKGNSYSKKSENSQDAHEAIRPVSIFQDPKKIRKDLSDDEYKLYNLIWRRTVQSQMKASIYESTRITINSNGNIFYANGNITLFDGFKKVWKMSDNTVELPDIEEGDILKLVKIDKTQHFTNPPPRYTEASLVKTLEENGIGRPSTYSSIIDNIKKRNYVNLEQRKFHATKLGINVSELLDNNFSDIINVKFTAEMEDTLDSVEDAEVYWKDVLNDFYVVFENDLKNAEEDDKTYKVKDKKTGEKCPVCGGDLVYKDGRNGRFIGCSNFPDCTYTANIKKTIGVDCPKCGGDILEKVSKRGKVFYGCDNYPECDFASWDKPIDERCPKCGDILVHKKNRKENVIKCHNENCDYERPFKDEK